MLLDLKSVIPTKKICIIVDQSKTNVEIWVSPDIRKNINKELSALKSLSLDFKPNDNGYFHLNIEVGALEMAERIASELEIKTDIEVIRKLRGRWSRDEEDKVLQSFLLI